MIIRVFLLLSLAAPMAFATTIPWSHDASAQNIPGGTGQDFERVRVIGEEEQLRDGTFFFRFSVNRRELLAYNLPHLSVMQKCEFHRTAGGSIGDYKPKGFQPIILIGYGSYTGLLFQWGSYGQDFNDNPVDREFQFARGETRIVLNDSSRRAFELFCAQEGTGEHRMAISWLLAGRCRWKPENWHKPENFPFEYSPRLEAKVQRTITTYCVP